MGDKWSDDRNANVSGAKYPLLWPATLADEDQVSVAISIIKLIFIQPEVTYYGLGSP